MNYQKLTAGNLRLKGDEYRQLWNHRNYGSDDPNLHNSRAKANPSSWQPVSLIGWPILSSDLINAEFRRPCKP